MPCINCKYFSRYEDQPDETQRGFDDLGDCRKYAPRPVSITEILCDDDGLFAYWPTTSGDQWCGEWQEGNTTGITH